MALSTVSFESVLATIVAVLFAVAGVVNLARLGAVKRDFARWGYPAWFPLLCGNLELHSILGDSVLVYEIYISGRIS